MADFQLPLPLASLLLRISFLFLFLLLYQVPENNRIGPVMISCHLGLCTYTRFQQEAEEGANLSHELHLPHHRGILVSSTAAYRFLLSTGSHGLKTKTRTEATRLQPYGRTANDIPTPLR